MLSCSHISFTDHLIGRVWIFLPSPLLISGLWEPKQHVEASPSCTERVFSKAYVGSHPVAPGRIALASPHLSGPWVGYGDEKSFLAQCGNMRIPWHTRWRAVSWGPAATLMPLTPIPTELVPSHSPFIPSSLRGTAFTTNPRGC